MTPNIRAQLKQELALRGYIGRMAPHGTMWLDDAYLAEASIGDLMDQLIARREKVFGSVAAVGERAAKESYEDVVAAIDALKAVLERMVLPPT
jgi:hypothetical protein